MHQMSRRSALAIPPLAIVATFARHGAPVDMIQIGNEVTAGMLWPVGELYPADGTQRWSSPPC